MELVVSFAVVASLCDAKRHILPNKLLGFMALLALWCQLCRWMGGAWLWWSPWLERVHPVLESPIFCLGLALGVMLVLGWWELRQRDRGEGIGLGFGDIKLTGCWVLALGTWGLWALALGCATGAALAVKRHARTFALGPWMSGWAIGFLIGCALI